MGEIRNALRAKGCNVPLVADVHHNGVKIAMEVAQRGQGSDQSRTVHFR